MVVNQAATDRGETVRDTVRREDVEITFTGPAAHDARARDLGGAREERVEAISSGGKPTAVAPRVPVQDLWRLCFGVQIWL